MLDRVIRSVLVLCGLLALSGCSANIVVDGFTIAAERWERERNGLVRRAAFDLSCPAEQLEIQILTDDHRCARQVAVSGCGNRAVYLNQYNNSWLIDSAATGARSVGIQQQP